MKAVPRKTDEELRELAVHLCAGRVFTERCVPEQDRYMLRLIFLPFTFMDEVPDNLGLVYEYLDEAVPQSINGYPQFFTCRFLATEDIPRFREHLRDVDTFIHGGKDEPEQS